MTTKRALMSVSDKTGLTDFARSLSDTNIELVASGGTAQTLREAGLSATSVEEYTGLPSVLGGRVKTLHPAIHGGILARHTDDDRATLAQQGWHAFDVVVVNLYPFVKTIGRADVTSEEAIEQIDIGGVALLRAAAKNHERVTVIADPVDYHTVLAELRKDGTTRPETRLFLARKAFAHTAAYDHAIAGYLSAGDDENLPAALNLTLPRSLNLRYGENPHQQAALYSEPGVGPLGGELLQGKPLSYNNLLDLDAAWACAADFEHAAVVIVKHLSPCGIACADNQAEAFRSALASDPVSAFGGVIATNRPFNEATAEALSDLFVEAIAAPAFSDAALDILGERKNCRLLTMGDLPAPAHILRSVRGGALLQTPDAADESDWQIVTQRQPTNAELESLRFAWRAVAHVKSNAIVLAQGQATVGIGGGLPSRVDSVKLAVMKAGDAAQGSALASDAFFPFEDGPRTAAEAGVTAIVQPGGSVRDEQVIATANELGLAMCFTGVRHFKH